MIDIALVGTGGMMPLPNRYLSSMICRVNGKMILFDCGEGTQVSLKLLGWGYKNIDFICFTHFHADHISGLPGLLLTIKNTERTEPVHFFGPVGLKRIVESLCVIAPEISFEMIFHEWGPGLNQYQIDNDLSLRALPLQHRAPCYGYRLDLIRRGKFDPERAKKNNVPLQIWSKLQKQNDAEIVYGNKTYRSDMVLGPERRGLALAYCTDTRPTPGLPGFVSGADLFICEGLYGDEYEKAASHMHMSYSEAAEIAKKGNVKELWLTHFSPALTHPKQQLHNATRIFKNTVAGKDRMTKTLKFDEEQD